jgi:hypothetical protein
MKPPAPPNNTDENDSGTLSIKDQPILHGIEGGLLEPAFYDGALEPPAASVFEENPF